MSSQPTVAVLVLNLNGRDHLSACLPGLDAQVYPNREIVIVDNGSTDGSVDYVRRAHAGVRVLELGENRGFCAAYNAAVAAVDTDFVVFLNNDTRVEPDWLGELVAAALRHDASAVASRILDWDGRRIDFIGGEVAFNGHAWQTAHGQSAATTPAERELLFACGGSMLVSRHVFLDTGGFDDDFFAYFEDVDLGWRLSVLGHRIVLAPKAVTYHRLHGTSGAWAIAPRLRLYERNALATIFKNYEDATLARVLPAAIGLTLARALSAAGLDPDAFRLGGSRPPGVAGLPSAAVAYLIALEDFARSLPSLVEKRAAIQSRRRRSDHELFVLFGEPLRLHDVDERYLRTARALIADFGIDEIVRGAATRASTPTGARVRSIEVLAERPTVSVIIPTMLGEVHLPACLEALAEQDYPHDRFEVLVVDNGAPRDLTSLVERSRLRGHVLKPGRNLGFAGANNLGVAEAEGDYVAFLNDDTRAEPQWLSAMVAAATRRRAAAIAAYVVDWDALLVDFAGGLVNFEGKGHQAYVHARVDAVSLNEQPVLFANGAAMLAHTATLKEAGGWDERTFAYYEDVELGWRLWMLGHEVWFAPDARVRHRHHGTSGRWPEPPRVRLLERNALRMIYALLETDHLARVLPAALLLAADRALLQTSLHRGAPEDPDTGVVVAHPPIGERARQELRMRGARRDLPLMANLRRVGPRGLAGAVLDTVAPSIRRSAAPASRRAYLIERERQDRAFDGRREAIPADAAARLLGIQDFLDDLPALSERRQHLQSRRARSDAEILGRFGDHWLSPVPATDQSLHNALHDTLVRVLGLAIATRSESA